MGQRGVLPCLLLAWAAMLLRRRERCCQTVPPALCCALQCRELAGSYLAILEPRAADVQALAARCLSQQQYVERRQARQSEQQEEMELQHAELRPEGGAVAGGAAGI